MSNGEMNFDDQYNPEAEIQGEGLEMGKQPTELEQVVMAKLDFSQAATVKAIGFRFLIPVPDLGTENQTHVIKNWRGEDVEVTGFKFINPTDNAPQAVVGDGTGVIIVPIDAENTNGEQKANEIFKAIEDLGGFESLNVEKLTRLISIINNEIKITDIYDSNDKIADKMQGQEDLVKTGERPFGYYKKDDPAGPKAIYVQNPSNVLDGPHAGKATYEKGFMAVQIPAKKEGQEPTYRSVAPEAIHYCYGTEEGELLTAQKLPQVTI